MEKRLEWIDAIRGFAIFCITLAHLAPDVILEQHICSFIVFTFFFISGYLHKSHIDSVSEYIKKSAKTILIPFLCWHLLSILIEMCLLGFSPDIVKKLFLINGELSMNSPIWFLWVFFLAQTLFVLIEKVSTHCDLICIVASLIFGFLFSGHRTSFLLNLLPVALLPYVVGKLFK